MKHVRAAAALIMVLVCLPLCGLSAEAPYYTMTQNHDGEMVYSQAGYLPDLSFFEFEGKALKRPADLFVDDKDNLFIADDGNKRVIYCTSSGEYIRTYGEQELKNPVGLYAREGRLYIADTKLESVLVYDIDTGDKVFELTRPDNVLYGAKSAYRPSRVGVDNAGSIYVITKGNTNGIAQFSYDGTFLGYLGANDTSIPFSEQLKRLFMTESQKEKLISVVPATPTGIDLDGRGLIYTVTGGLVGFRRLSLSGNNTISGITTGFSTASDVATGMYETVFVLDQNGFINEYTRDGRVLFFFGGMDADRTRAGLFVTTTAIDVDSRGNLYVLDKDKALVQRFAMTEYASTVHEALNLYQNGLYERSREPWERLLRLNSMFDYAQMGLGRAYYKLEMYGEALTASRLGGDRDGYSDAFWEVRNLFLQNNILWIFAGIALASILMGVWKRYKKRRPPAAPRSGRVARLAREIRFSMYFLKNPSDAFYGVKREGKVSVLSATILYLLFFLLYMVNKYASGFLFKTVADGQFEVGIDLMTVFGGLTLFLVACNLICNIRDGEGTVKQMYCGLAYVLTPYLLLKPLRFALTFVLTQNEAFVISLVDLLAVLGCLVLLLLMVRYLQEYTMRETVVCLLLTVFTMLMLVIAMVICAAMFAQLWEFLSSVVKEARFFYES